MNEIESKAAGRIVKILVENGQPWSTGSRSSFSSRHGEWRRDTGA